MLSCHVLISRRFEFSGHRKGLTELGGESGAIFRNVGIQLPHDESFYPRKKKESSATLLRKLQNLQNVTTYDKQQPASGYKISTSKTGAQHIRAPTVSGPIRSAHPGPLILISILWSLLCLCYSFTILSVFRKPVAKSECELLHICPSVLLAAGNKSTSTREN